MASHRFYLFTAAWISICALSACNGTAVVPAISPGAQQVQVEDHEPPAGATALGEIKVTHGKGCSFSGDSGTREGATALLREAAAQRGANFVQVTQVVEPYSGHDCVHREFTISGLSYRLANTPSTASTASAASTPAAVPAAAPPAPLSPHECMPPCSPGYGCEAGVCRALCNPACGPDQTCRADRVCVAAALAPVAPIAPVAPVAPLAPVAPIAPIAP
ncbi:MAG TPA: hypothetical protein VER12_19320 [Polyangiaceae bacterium]|nr:hypothetical protein [Polyangiaceae bacterium]